ncbi:MAG: RluA family pseudouridine synthase, partial [Oscillochloris sp.]|nr:RluA family pseudouridine synthase [Oscillochloris sp.]
MSGEDARCSIVDLAERLLPGLGAQIALRGGAWLDGRRVAEPDMRPQAGQQLVLRPPPEAGYTNCTLVAADIAYEDTWLVALHKRLGWYVGATPWDDHGHTLAAAARYLRHRDGSAPPLHLAHQLDRDTSGILLISKAPMANPQLTAAFAGGQVEKLYRALVLGAPPEAGVVRSGHGRAASGRWRLYPLDELGRSLP